MTVSTDAGGGLSPGFRVTIRFVNSNPDTIWNRLTVKLGREPTDEEATAEVRRILSEAYGESSR